MPISLKSIRRLAEKVGMDKTTEQILQATEEAVNGSKARIERSLRWLARLKGLDFTDRAVALTEWVAAEEAIADE